ncbi:MAG: pyruvate, phosphate dikinase [Candidatus Actinomarinales bacterium]|nr:MAG: pyruvate, phosphate dikinase [Candidatus Actinomarinales bacterium]
MDSYVYKFIDTDVDGGAEDTELLGSKGANLSEMAKLGLPIPPGFTITTEACNYFFENEQKFPNSLDSEIKKTISLLEKNLNKTFGRGDNPLLLSIRSGAQESMPGMMDSILNLGLNDETVLGLENITKNRRFALDSYRRFLQMYGDIVLGIEHSRFEAVITNKKRIEEKISDVELDENDLEWIINGFKNTIERFSGKDFPQDPNEQLRDAISAVFNSWMNPRAITYRKINNIPDSWGTGVTVQSMVFGNLNENSGTGVAFTRNPSDGTKKIFGEYLLNAQGEDVVAGTRTPFPLAKEGKTKGDSLEEAMPEIYKKIEAVCNKLEKHYKDMQDIEFTIENGDLYLLQTRTGKRSARASLKIAVDLVNERLINKQKALLRVKASDIENLLHPNIKPGTRKELFGKGLNASPGAATGVISFSAEETEELSNKGFDVILVREETSPEDIQGMFSSRGVITTRGGMTSHAAVVARGMGRPCIAGAEELLINYEKKTISNREVVLNNGDTITIDGTTGEIFLGELETVDSEPTEDYKTIMEWADQYRRLKIRANSETIKDTEKALSFGAEGIGLCRTEHMFFEGERIIYMREMIMADTEQGRKKALKKILNYQKDDFKELFKLVQGKPITVRFLDPPMHEFLPSGDLELKDVAEASGISFDYAKEKSLRLHEANPMLGHRGVRLAISYPEIYKMQARAVFEALIEVKKENKISTELEIMIPLIATGKELSLIKKDIKKTCRKIEKKHNTTIEYKLGTMIELPSAALRAEEISQHADFFSFGTNDLTQTTLGLSRDDSAKFLEEYIDKEIFHEDPFSSIDIKAVGKLVELATESGLVGNKKIKIGICGEHGGDPKSIIFFEKIGLDYVSCSPYRIPVAKLSAAQACINGE